MDSPPIAQSPNGSMIEGGSATASGFARLSRDSLLYALGSVAGKAIGVALLPVYTRLLTPDQYGRFEVLASLGGATISVLLLGMDVAATRLLLDPARTTRDRRQLIGAWILLEGLIVVPAAAAVFIAGPVISDVLFRGDAPDGGVQLIGLILLAGVPQYMALTMLRIQRRPIASAAVTAGTLALNGVLAIALLLLWSSDERAALLAYGLGLVGGAVVAFALVGRNSIARPEWANARALLSLGLPLLPAVAATTISDFLNRTILLGASGATEVGYFGVAIRIASVVGLLVGGIYLAWQPHAFALGTSQEALRRTGVDAGRILVIVSSAVALIGIGAPELVLLVSSQTFQPATPVVGVALVGSLATAVYLVASMPSALAARTKDIGIAGSIGVGVAVAINLLLAPVAGALGTAASIAIGQVIASVIVFRLGRPHAGLQLRPATAIVVLLAGVIAIMSAVPNAVPIALRGAFLAVFALAAWHEGTLREVFRYCTRFLR